MIDTNKTKTLMQASERLHKLNMKTDWMVGDTFYFCKHSSRKERGTLVDNVPFGKYTVENVDSDYVESGHWIFYFDEIKPVIRVKGD